MSEQIIETQKLNYISLDYNFLTSAQKAVISCFIRRNNLVENWVIPNQLDQVICFVTDFEKEELARDFHIELDKFGKARQPPQGQLEDKFFVLTVFRALLKEQPRVYSDESLKDFFEDSTESDQTSQNVTAIFNNGEQRHVTASNLRSEGDSANIANRDHLVISIENPAAQAILEQNPEVSIETTVERKPKILVHQKLVQPLLIAKQEPRFVTSKLDTIEIIEEHLENQSDKSLNPGRETIDSQDEEESIEEEENSKKVGPKKSSTERKPKQKKNFLGKVSKIMGLSKPSDSDDSESNYCGKEHDSFHLTAEDINEITKSMNSSVRKIGEKQIVPIWRMASSAEDQFTALETYIMDLIFVSNMGLELNEKALIFQSINASGRTNLIHTMPPEACESIDNFITYLHKAYGRTPVDMRSRLNNLKRDPYETMHSYLAKVMRIYYMTHNKTAPTIKKLSTAKDMEAERQDIVYHFLHGLQHPALARELRLRMHEIDLSKLADVAKQLYEVLEAPKPSEVHNVETTLEKEFRECIRETEASKDGQLCQEEVNFVKQMMNRQNRNRNFRPLKDVTCYKCKRKGHYANNCRSGFRNGQGDQRKEDKKPGIQCHNCGNYGHKKQDCRPAPTKNGYSHKKE